MHDLSAIRLITTTNLSDVWLRLEGPLYVPNAPERQMGDRIGIDRFRSLPLTARCTLLQPFIYLLKL